MKRYTIRYEKKLTSVITAISNYSDLSDIIKGDAKDSKIETKMHENMPLVLHNLIAKHNAKIDDLKK